MKPNVVSATIQPTTSSPLTALPVAKIVRHPRSKTEKAGVTLLHPDAPDEETLHRLNVLAKQLFCRLHKGSNSPLL